MPQSPTHILGIGNLGKLVAHALRKNYPKSPITLCFHRPTLVKSWDAAGRSIDIMRNEISDCQIGFDYELPDHGESGIIEKMVVATKTHATVSALRPFAHRLRPTSTLLFLQNGIGTIDEVSNNIFTDPETRPFFLTGIFNHGVFATSPFSSVHAGLADAFIGPASVQTPKDRAPISQTMPETAQDLAQSLVECPELATTLQTADEIFHIQIRKLAVNAVINPLTAIHDIINGQVFEHPESLSMIDGLVSEFSAVFLAILSQREPGMDFSERYAPARIRENVKNVAGITSKNVSSMRQDIRHGRRTEVDYINGYIVRKGRELGVTCDFNEEIVRMVKDKERTLGIA